MSIQCWLKTIKRTFADNPMGLLQLGAYTSGHSYVELCDNNDVHVLKCVDCGHLSVAFHFDPDERMKENMPPVEAKDGGSQ